MKQEIRNSARILWDYLYLNEPIEPADVILGLGCMDENIPKTCAKLYKQGYGNYIVFSGNVGKGTQGVLNMTEAAYFKQIAQQEGVPDERILIEPQATNTYENFYYSRLLLEKTKIQHNRIIVVQKPYVERRCRAIADVWLPENSVFVTSSKLSFDQFFDCYKDNPAVPQTDIIEELVGEITIIANTPKYGLQSAQRLPQKVTNCCERLQTLGFHKYVMNDQQIEAALIQIKQTIPEFAKQIEERQLVRNRENLHKIK